MLNYRKYRKACLEEERLISRLSMDVKMSIEERMKLMREYSSVFKTKMLKR